MDLSGRRAGTKRHIVLRNPNHGIQWNNKLGWLRESAGEP